QDSIKSREIDCSTIVEEIKLLLNAERNEQERLKKEREYLRTVPEFQPEHFDYPIRAPGLFPHQQKFYEVWKIAWEKGETLDLEGQVGYAFKYVLSTALKKSPREAIADLIRIIESYSGDDRFIDFKISEWLSDCYVLTGEYKKAADAYPPPANARRNNLLSLKLAQGKQLDGEDVLNLFGTVSLTIFGKQHLPEIKTQAENILDSYQRKDGNSLLDEWAKECHLNEYKLFSWTSYFQKANINLYDFEGSLNATEYIDFFRDIIRQAENEIRQKFGVPMIGEGWVEEVSLYYSLKSAFSNLKVQHHASPMWLGYQHLDIFIPDLKVAIEYQGVQHDQPVDFFGGEEGFKSTQERDTRKLRLCNMNGVKLIYVRPGYLLKDLVAQIQQIYELL
ncbi:MAG TPA: hypothetical protein VKQ72_00585, partial [Aggregatilineales bacterium]|nr:hypothetical protein [Aggregatilineales bacterium]